MFLTVLNMSITASYVILAVLLVRLLLRRAPKKYSYWLWSVVGFRLCCPISFQSVFSLFSLKPFDMTKAQAETAHQLRFITADERLIHTEITTGIPFANQYLPQQEPAGMTSINPSQIWIPLLTAVWLAGMLLLLLWGLIGYLRLARKMRTAIRIEGDLYAAEEARSPFILGYFRPRIYLPLGVEESYILEHERYHLQHWDHWVRLFGFLLLCLHWFNPLCWLAFQKMGQDMELRCDEAILKKHRGIAKEYSTALLSFATDSRFPSPLAFSESSVKKRIKNALRKPPAKWLQWVAILVCSVVLVSCAANPKKEKSPAAGGERLLPETIESGLPEVVLELQSSALRCDTPYLQLRWKNEGSADLILRSEFDIQRAEGDQWISTGGQGESGRTVKAGKAEVVHYHLEQFDLDTMGRYRFIHEYETNGTVHQAEITFSLNAPSLMQMKIVAREGARIIGGDVNYLMYRPGQSWDFAAWGVQLTIGEVTEASATVTLWDVNYAITDKPTVVEQNGVTVELTLMAESPLPTDYYVYKGEVGIFRPSLTLNKETGHFSFYWDPASSYLAMGLYVIEGDVLTAFTGDGQNVYRFRIVDEDTLAFIQAESSTMPHYTTEPLEDGALFTKKMAS
ncbi:MAG: hypothetical protein IJP27_05810 [Clostridia bacterium]|nr:hypothetical protein [Clostridia bacterium]